MAVIQGAKVGVLDARAIGLRIADSIGASPELVRRGRNFRPLLEAVARHLGIGAHAEQAEARLVEAILSHVGLVYDPMWDTTEATAGAGAAVVTERGLSRMLAALTGVPRCFIFNVSDTGAGAAWETEHERYYRYDADVTGRGRINQAGPGSRIVYYATSNSKANKQTFISIATVQYIEETGPGKWQVHLTDYQPFTHPVWHGALDLPGWNRQHAITEITPETFDALVGVGLGIEGEAGGSHGGEPGPWAELSADTSTHLVERMLARDFPVTGAVAPMEVPDELPRGALRLEPIEFAPATDRLAAYAVGEDDDRPERVTGSIRSTSRDRLAERRAIDIATEAMLAAGWSLVRDCQADGVGYDLEFERNGRNLRVEVKGIQGPFLRFNLTPKELAVASTNDEWILVAVTSVLSPRDFKPVVLTRDVVCAARREPLGFRVFVDDGE